MLIPGRLKAAECTLINQPIQIVSVPITKCPLPYQSDVILDLLAMILTEGFCCFPAFSDFPIYVHESLYICDCLCRGIYFIVSIFPKQTL